MDRLWIKKLRELKSRMLKHLAEKAVFESLPERTSLAALREGQRLKRIEEQISNHFAQLAEFATGIPSSKFDFRLDLKSVYETDHEGNLIFGPSALIDEYPYINFNVQNLFKVPAPAEAEERESELEEDGTPEKIPVKTEKPQPDIQPLSLTFSSEISRKYDRPLFSALDERRMTVMRPVKPESRIDNFIARVSSVDKYVNNIINKYSPEPSEAPVFEGFYIYEGDFIYLSRKGKWAAVRTTVLAQKDYFKDTPVSAPETKRKLPAYEPFREIKISDAADLITDDLAEPVASVKSDLGLGYFLPVRRVGKTEETKMPALPLVGSPGFSADVAQKAESSGHPIEEIGPSYIAASGRKIERARSFTRALKSRLHLPESELARKAVEALLPKMQHIIRRSETEEAQEEAILAIERDFDSLVGAHLEPFKIAARSTAQSRVSPVLREGRIETALESPTQDALGVFARFQPETVGRETPVAVMLRRLGGPVSRTLPSTDSAISLPAITETSQVMATAAPVQAAERTEAETVRGLPSLLRRMASALPIDRLTEAVSGVMRDLPGRLPTERLSSFAGDIMNRFSEGISGQIGQRFEHLLQPSRITELAGQITPGRIGQLLQRGAAGDIVGRIKSSRGIGGLASSLLRQAQPSGLLQNLFGSRESAGGATPEAAAESAQRGGLLGRLLEAPTSLMRGGIGRLVSGLTGESRGAGDAASLLSRGRGLLGGLAGGSMQMAERIASRGLGGLSGITSALGIGGGQSSGTAPGERTHRPGFGAGLGSLISSVGGRGGTPDAGGGVQRATGAVSGLVSRGLSGLSSMVSGVPGIGGALGAAASRASSFAEGLSQRASGFVGQATSAAGGFLQRTVSRAAGGIGSLVSGGMGRVAQRSDGMMGGIGGLISRGAGAVQEGASSLLGRVGALGASLPSMGGARSMAEGAIGRAREMLPESMPDISSAMGSGSLPFNLPQLQRGMPRGWDRPPFEVGDAIQRHIGDRLPEGTAGQAQRAVSRLVDYGLSLIDLEDEGAEQVRSPLEALQDEEEVELDDDTIESIYFRLKRILETEEERMGGEA